MRENRGIILLEVIIATAFLGVLLLAMWGSFHKFYNRYEQTYKEGSRLEEVTTILEFIQEELQDAEAVRIETKSQLDIMASNQDILEEPLKSITFIPNKQQPTKNKTKISAVLKKEGYEIVYQEVTIAENITNMTVSRENHSSLVEITCAIRDKNGELVSASILLSLVHKQ